MEPGTLILDEPAAGLDPAGRRDMLALIRGIHARGVTVVMVSHSMDDVGQLCDRVFVLNHGALAFSGTPAEVFRHGRELRGIGLDVPQCATLAALLREKGFEIPADLYAMDDVARAILNDLKAGEGASHD